MSALDDTKILLEELIACPAVSPDGRLCMIAHLARKLTAAGAHVEIWHGETGTKARVLATLAPERDGGIVLSGHSDVVPVTGQDWSSDPFEMAERGGKWHGRGTCDMKGLIAAAVAMALRYAALDLARRYVSTSPMMKRSAASAPVRWRKRGIRPAIAIIGEPTSMRIIEGHRGRHECTTHSNGLVGHGSAPDRGVNAVECAARHVTKLHGLKADLKRRAPANRRSEPPWSTISTGAPMGGVAARNVIAGKARVEREVRPVQMSDAT